ncbi:MAG: hypothetical protein MST07_06005 [Firmicutes bacterium]|nr:hypothetical protein [Bacillota bacterium]
MTFIYSAIVVVLCLLIIAIAWPTEAETEPVNKQSSTDMGRIAEPDTDSESSDDEEKDQSAGEKNIISEKGASYYLVKSVDGRIKVFFVNEEGEKVELETTEIVYELLSTSDQKLFDEGVTLNSQEELAVLLQDFES